MKFDDLSYLDKVDILDAIKNRAEILQNQVKVKRAQKGKCTHPEIVDISTIIDVREGYRKKKCLECGATWKQSIEGADN